MDIEFACVKETIIRGRFVALETYLLIHKRPIVGQEGGRQREERGTERKGLTAHIERDTETLKTL